MKEPASSQNNCDVDDHQGGMRRCACKLLTCVGQTLQDLLDVRHEKLLKLLNRFEDVGKQLHIVPTRKVADEGVGG